MSDTAVIDRETKLDSIRCVNDTLMVEMEDSAGVYAGGKLLRPGVNERTELLFGRVIKAGPSAAQEILDCPWFTKGRTQDPGRQNGSILPPRIVFGATENPEAEVIGGKKYYFVQCGRQEAAFAIIPAKVDGSSDIEVDGCVIPIGDRIFVEWERAPETYGGSRLVRPESHKSNHHTGIILAVGADVTEELRFAGVAQGKGSRSEAEVHGPRGCRIVFDQFSGVAKFEDARTNKRYAFLRESHQGSAFAIIPPRADGSPLAITGGEGAPDYEN